MKVFIGTKLRDFTPLLCLHIIDNQEMFSSDLQCPVGLTRVQLSATDLNATQRAELIGLLEEFGDIFAARDGSGLGCTTAVQHEIQTSGPPIWQPAR